MIYLPLSTAVWCSGMFVQQIGWAVECSLPMTMSLEQFPSYCFLPPANEVWGKVMFLHLSVIGLSGVVCPIVCWDTHSRDQRQTPPRQTPIGQTPPGQTTHPRILWDTVNKWVVLECILVYNHSRFCK